MAKSRNKNTGTEDRDVKFPQDEVPPGATRKAFDREDNGGGPGGSPLGDRHAQGDGGGGDELGGLGGSPVGDGDPVLPEDMDRLDEDEAGPFAGRTGGAVGGTPAGRRATGGKTGGGLRPGGTHRGDSTIGSDPDR